jgi:hypothetical protein
MNGPLIGNVELGRQVQIGGVVRVGPEDPSAGGNQQSVEASVAAAAVADEGATGRQSIVPMRSDDGGVFGPWWVLDSMRSPWWISMTRMGALPLW